MEIRLGENACEYGKRCKHNQHGNNCRYQTHKIILMNTHYDYSNNFLKKDNPNNVGVVPKKLSRTPVCLLSMGFSLDVIRTFTRT